MDIQKAKKKHKISKAKKIDQNLDTNVKRTKKKKYRSQEMESEKDMILQHNLQPPNIEHSTEKNKKRKRQKHAGDEDCSNSIVEKKMENEDCNASKTKQTKKKNLDANMESLNYIDKDEHLVTDKYGKKKKKKCDEHECSKYNSSSGKEKKMNKKDTTHLSEKQHGEVKPFVGQWRTASLGTEERNDKFIKLMGGFKSKNVDKDKFHKTFSGFAVDEKKEGRLNKGLQEQYEKAWETTKLKKGKGLGYEPDLNDGKPSFSF